MDDRFKHVAVYGEVGDAVPLMHPMHEILPRHFHHHVAGTKPEYTTLVVLGRNVLHQLIADLRRRLIPVRVESTQVLRQCTKMLVNCHSTRLLCKDVWDVAVVERHFLPSVAQRPVSEASSEATRSSAGRPLPPTPNLGLRWRNTELCELPIAYFCPSATAANQGAYGSDRSNGTNGCAGDVAKTSLVASQGVRAMTCSTPNRRCVRIVEAV